MAENTRKASTTSKPRKTATTKKVAPANNTHLTQLTASREEVAMLAHRFWAERGRQHGHDAEDWFRAEQELLGKAS
jgi:hypothetical protein